MNENRMIDVLSTYLGSYRWWLCPNIMHGRNEIDLLAVSRSGWAYEWEIKCSLSDWKNDLRKGLHGEGMGRGSGIAFFNYCVVEDIARGDLGWVPSYAGIYTVNPDSRGVRVIRRPKKLSGAVLWDKTQVWRACYYRYWGLREKYRRGLNQMKDRALKVRVNDSLRGVLLDVEERQRAPLGVMLPHSWGGGKSALEKIKQK